MTSRERIEAIFSGRTPDRVGRYEQSVYSSVGSAILGRKAHTGGTSFHMEEAEAFLKGGSAHDDLMETMYRDRAELGEILKFDMIAISWLHRAKPTKKTGDYEYLYGDPDGDYSLYRYDPVSETFGEAGSSRKNQSIEDLKADVAAMEKSLDEESSGDSFVEDYLKRLISDFGDTLEVLGGGGMAIPLDESWLMACATDPGVVAAFLDVQAEYCIRSMRLCSELGIRVIWGGGDFADNSGPIYGPKVFRDLFLPRWKRIADECHRLGMWYLLRSDGDLWTVTDMIFDEAGIDGYGEIDWAAGMDLARLKPRYDNVTYWGNVPPGVVRNGTRDEVLAAAKHCIEAFADRRLIFGSSNSILPGTPVENVLALTEAVDMWGG